MNRGTVRRGSPMGDIASRVGARCHLETARVGTAAYLVPVGELELSCVKKFRETLAKSVADTPTDLVIDLRSVTFIDSTGLGLLLRANKLAGEEGIRLHVVGSPTEIVRAVFEASGLNKVLSLVDEPPRLQGG